MTENFQVGSIADLVDRTRSRIKDSQKKSKKLLLKKRLDNLTKPISKKSKILKHTSQNFDINIENDDNKKSTEKKKSVLKSNLKSKKAKTNLKQKKKKLITMIGQVGNSDNPEKELKDKIEDERDENDNDGNENIDKQKEETQRTNKNKVYKNIDQGKQLRTLFIGNLPANFPLKNLKKLFQQYGKVVSIRIRCVAPAKITLSKKVAYLSNQVNQNKKTVNAYIVFKDPESVKKALELNGTTFEGHTIQVDTLENDRVYDHSLSLFLGNLSFKTNEDELREFFKDCGQIKSVRIVRDNKTGIGKGFGYVNFQSKDSIVLALEKNGQMLKNREIRIKPYKYDSTTSSATTLKKSKKPPNKNNTNPSSSKTLKRSAISNDYQGEQGIKKKKLLKKTMKNRLNAYRINTQKIK